MPDKKDLIIFVLLCVIALGLGYWYGLPDKPSEERAEAGTPSEEKADRPSKSSSPTQGKSSSRSFAEIAEPIFRKHGCNKCHNSKESNKVEADFDLSDRTTWRAFLAPNQKGNPATTPLVLALTATAADGRPMPHKGARVSDAEVETIKKWIVAGWE